MIDTIRDGHAVICDNPLSPANTFYYNWDNPIIYRYNIETALNMMVLAGYDVIDEPPTISIPPSDDPTDPTISEDDSGFEMSFLFGLISMGVMVLIRRRR